MSSDPIPDAVRRFLLTSIPSVPFLEALLLLQEASGKHWDAIALARRLYLSEKACVRLLDELHAAGFALVDTSGKYHYGPETEEIKAVIAIVRDVYSKNLVGVSNLIRGFNWEVQLDELRREGKMR